MTKMRREALITWSRPLILAVLMATTNGEAAAEVLALRAKASSMLLYGTTMPRKKTETT
jgi:hypothetical protein